MLVRPFHLLLGAVCSVIAVFMIAVAMDACWTLLMKGRDVVEMAPEELVEAQPDEAAPAADEDLAVDDQEPDHEVKEVMILPPTSFVVRTAEDLPAEWDEEVLVEEEELAPRKRFTDFTEATGLVALTAPEDTERISSEDMAAGSTLDAADPDGDDVPTTADGRDDERLDSLIDSQLGNADSPGNGGAGTGAAAVDSPPTPTAMMPESEQVDVNEGAAQSVAEVEAIPGLDQVAVESRDGDEEGESEGEADESGLGQPETAQVAGGAGDIQRIKRRFKGRTNRNGIDSLAARGTASGRYLAAISKRITRNWQRACHDPVNGQHITNGMIKTTVTVGIDGAVQSVKVDYSEGATTVQQNFTREAVENTELPPFPADFRDEVGDEPIEVEFDFLFFVR